MLAAVVEVCGSHRRRVLVYQHYLLVGEALGEAVELHPGAAGLGEVGKGRQVDHEIAPCEVRVLITAWIEETNPST